jgi:hypothetical protein
MALSNTQKDSLLRGFWFILAMVLIAGTVALFESRNAERDIAISDHAKQVLDDTLEAYPSSTVAMNALMQCIQKKGMRVEKSTRDDDLNRPRQVCPKYGTALEATHPSPMGMRELELAYSMLITGLKSKL